MSAGDYLARRATIEAVDSGNNAVPVVAASSGNVNTQYPTAGMPQVVLGLQTASSATVRNWVEAGATGDGGANGLGAMASWAFNGATWDRARTPIIFKTINALSIASEATIWQPAAGKKFRLMGFHLASGTAGGAILLKDNTAGTTIYIVPKIAIDTAIISPAMGNGILSAAANNVLTATGVATQTLTGVVFGTEE